MNNDQTTPHLILINPDGETMALALEAPPSTEFLQRMIDGWLEEVPGFTHYAGQPCIAYMNEEGKRMRLPLNMTATKLWMLCDPKVHDILLGVIAVIIGPRDFLATV